MFRRSNRDPLVQRHSVLLCQCAAFLIEMGKLQGIGSLTHGFTLERLLKSVCSALQLGAIILPPNYTRTSITKRYITLEIFEMLAGVLMPNEANISPFSGTDN